MSLRGTGTAALGAHAMFLPHALPCSDGDTALKWAIHYKKPAVAAYLHSIGAPQ